ncbi:MAG TPA: hypothetical protein DCZ94_07640 [Lentisphaeria bacterium]|nr:MAG: hypothetical protein A2X48_14320 [Lentisphaerae bacterium GWF2_49_21]HBC86809.1 hypothetical protein [Lentisphaeria bacterium]
MQDERTEKSYSDTLSRMGHSSLSMVKTAGYDAWYGNVLPEDKNAVIYDYGCGHGDFLEYLSLKGYKVISGGDINSECARVATERVRVPIDKIGEMKEFSKINRGKYDFINLKDIIEHIDKESLVEFLSDIRETLRPDGFIIVSCPQICGFTSLFTLYDDFTHKTLFTENSLKYVLNSAGYVRIEFIRPEIPFSLNPLKMISRMARFAWFQIIRLIYRMERPGERMPPIPGDRIACKAWRG